MYKVSDGFNLETNDKTYFDKFNVMDLLSVSRSMVMPNSRISTQGSAPYKNSNSAMNIVDYHTKKHYAENARNDTDRISSVNEDTDSPRTVGR